MRFLIVFLIFSQFAFSQFAPPVGQPGTTAMSKDSTAFVAWANFCMIQRGLQNISNASGPYATVGDSSKAIGIADNNIVSLGDGGTAILTFPQPIMDGAGNDFAVFENSFSDNYLEFGFVEVSSDGTNFFRFPATCNIQDTAQTGSFGLSDATLVNNLAGKYKVLYGTPFDLAELQGVGGLNVNNITHVKIIDVVGSINSAYATYDKNNNKVNDPWPTAFGSSGFDLDAVGVINQVTNTVNENNFSEIISVYPNPAKESIHVKCNIKGENTVLNIRDVFGSEVISEKFKGENLQINISDLKDGIYFVQIKTNEKIITKKICISK
jgi:hypothetical protein